MLGMFFGQLERPAASAGWWSLAQDSAVSSVQMPTIQAGMVEPEMVTRKHTGIAVHVGAAAGTAVVGELVSPTLVGAAVDTYVDTCVSILMVGVAVGPVIGAFVSTTVGAPVGTSVGAAISECILVWAAVGAEVDVIPHGIISVSGVKGQAKLL